MSKLLDFIYSILISIRDFFSQVWDFFVGIPDFLRRFFVWLFDALANVVPWLIKTAGSAIGEWLNGLISSDTSGFLASFLNAGSSIPAGVAYFIAPFNLSLGIKFILAAYLIRFLIRRLPIFG